MIYLYQNDREYDYDVRAIALAFFEREKIIEVSQKEFDEQMAKSPLYVEEEASDSLRKDQPRFLHLDYEENRI